MAGAELSLRHCPTCDTRWWSDDEGRQVELTSVLELASRTRRRRRSA
ncbi:MAG TPA: hypothetical protein VFP54_07830 [Acidimicrobiales bacterium]|nr:hypothetical protein [Acidimicrobiales bacterium]